MKRLRVALLIVVTLLAGLGLGSSTTRAEPTGVYLALGDSVAVGIGSSLPRDRGYAALIGHQAATWSDGTMRVRNLGRVGETATSLRDDGQLETALQEIAAASASGNPVRAVTVTVGGNDLIAQQNQPALNREAALTSYTDALNTILGDLRAAVGPDVPIVVTTLWDPTSLRDTDLDAASWIARYNETILAAAAAVNAGVADLTPAFADGLTTLTYEPTDIHPTNAGHRLIADLVWQALALDTVAPVLDVPAELLATRPMLTLTIGATDDTGVATVTIAIDAPDGGMTVDGPWQTADNTWVVLLDLQTNPVDTGTLSGTVTVISSDAAGNTSEATVLVTGATLDAEQTPTAGATPTPEGGAP